MTEPLHSQIRLFILKVYLKLYEIFVRLLIWLLSSFFEDLDESEVNLGKWQVTLSKITLKSSLLEFGWTPYKIILARAESVEVSISGRNVSSFRLNVTIEKVNVLGVTSNRTDTGGKSTQLEKLKKLDALNRIRIRKYGIYLEESGFFRAFIRSILKRLVLFIAKYTQLQINGVHVRWEDDVTRPEMAMGLGVTLASFQVKNVNQVGDFGKTCDIKELAAYWKSSEKPVYSYLRDRQEMVRTMNTFSQGLSTCDYVIGPVSANIKMDINENSKQGQSNDTPSNSVQLDVQVHDAQIAIDERQLQDIVQFLETVDFHLRSKMFGKTPKERWKFAIESTKKGIQRRSRSWSWNAIRSHLQVCKRYAHAYLDVLHYQSQTELSLVECTECEKKLDLFNILLIREKVERRIADATEEQTTDQLDKGLSQDSRDSVSKYGTFVFSLTVQNLDFHVFECKNEDRTEGNAFHATVCNLEITNISGLLPEEDLIYATVQAITVTGIQCGCDLDTAPIFSTKLDQIGDKLVSVSYQCDQSNFNSPRVLEIRGTPVEITIDWRTFVMLHNFFAPLRNANLVRLKAVAALKLFELKIKAVEQIRRILETPDGLQLDIDLLLPTLKIPLGDNLECCYGCETNFLLVTLGDLGITTSSANEGLQTEADSMNAARSYSVNLKGFKIAIESLKHSKSSDPPKFVALSEVDVTLSQISPSADLSQGQVFGIDVKCPEIEIDLLPSQLRKLQISLAELPFHKFDTGLSITFEDPQVAESKALYELIHTDMIYSQNKDNVILFNVTFEVDNLSVQIPPEEENLQPKAGSSSDDFLDKMEQNGFSRNMKISGSACFEIRPGCATNISTELKQSVDADIVLPESVNETSPNDLLLTVRANFKKSVTQFNLEVGWARWTGRMMQSFEVGDLTPFINAQTFKLFGRFVDAMKFLSLVKSHIGEALELDCIDLVKLIKADVDSLIGFAAQHGLTADQIIKMAIRKGFSFETLRCVHRKGMTFAKLVRQAHSNGFTPTAILWYAKSNKLTPGRLLQIAFEKELTVPQKVFKFINPEICNEVTIDEK